MIDLTPSGATPLPLNPVTSAAGGNLEDVVVGRSIGEQRSDGSYHGHITILAALGNEILADDTVPGQSITGGLTPAQNTILGAACTTLQVCVSAVVANSTTTTSGTTNQFQAANVAIGNTAVPALNLGLISSDGNIATQAGCQVAHADSSVAQLNLSGTATVQALQSTSDTTTCNPGGTSVAPHATSTVVNVGGTGLSLPGLVPAGCANGTPNTDGGIPAILPIICNADDTGGSQTTIPYNVREALTLFVLSFGGGTGLAKVTAGASETAAQAPGTTGTTSTGTTSTGTTSTGTTSTGTTSTGTTSTGTTSTGTTSTGTTSTGTTSTGTTSTGTTSTGTTSTGTTTTGTTSTGTTSTGTTSTGTTSTGTTSTGTTSTGTTSESAASLPFTGYDMSAAVLLGVLLLGTGVGSRKLLASRARGRKGR